MIGRRVAGWPRWPTHRPMICPPELALLLRTDGVDPHERIDVHAIRLVGGNATGGRVRVKQESLFFEVAHGVANGRRRDPETEASRQRARARRLGRGHITVDHGFEDLSFPFGELWMRHNSNGMNDFGLLSTPQPDYRAATSPLEYIEPSASGTQNDPASRPARPTAETSPSRHRYREAFQGAEPEIHVVPRSGSPESVFLLRPWDPARRHLLPPRRVRRPRSSDAPTPSKPCADWDPAPCTGLLASRHCCVERDARGGRSWTLRSARSRRDRAGMRREKLLLVSVLRRLLSLSPLQPALERCAGLHREPVQRDMCGFEGECFVQVARPIALECRGNGEDEVDRDRREPGLANIATSRRCFGIMCTVHPAQDGILKRLDAE